MLFVASNKLIIFGVKCFTWMWPQKLNNLQRRVLSYKLCHYDVDMYRTMAYLRNNSYVWVHELTENNGNVWNHTTALYYSYES